MRAGILIALNKECTNNCCCNTNGCKEHREYSACDTVCNRTESDRRHDRTNIRLEKVSAHTCNVTYVVTYVIGNCSRVTRVILRNTGLDFTYQVSTNVGCLCVDTAAHTCKKCDGGSTKGETGKYVCITGCHINDTDTEKAKTYYAHTHNCTAGESDGKGLVHTGIFRCRCCSNVCFCCHVHTAITGDCGEQCTKEERDRGCPTDSHTDSNEENGYEEYKDLVLGHKESLCAFMNKSCNFFHTVSSGVLIRYSL